MQLLGHQTSFQSSTCLRINEITSGIDGESQKRHRRAIFIEEQVRMRAEKNNRCGKRSERVQKLMSSTLNRNREEVS